MTTFPDIEKLIPHRAPIRMIDTLTAYEGHTVSCSALLTRDNAYANGDVIPALVALELFAQTAAALFGYRAFLAKLPFGAGAIIGVQKMAVTRDFRAGERCIMTVEERFTVDQLTHARGTLTVDDIEVATGALTVLHGAPSDVTFRPQLLS